MKKRILLLAGVLLELVGGMGVAASETAAIAGDWRGDISIGIQKIPLVLHFGESDGTATCTLDSPSQNAFGIPAQIDFASADSISISAERIGATLHGRVRNGRITGKLAQHGHQLPVSLRRDVTLLERRPQTPMPPFPYQETDTVFYAEDGTALRGTLTFPEAYNRSHTPMCVFLTGSGPQNRDEELFEHKPFAVIADFLGRNGVASFRYDDRGTAQSGGNFATATIDTFCGDARAALLFARTFGEGATGIIGHSEGGSIAFLLAEEGMPDFVVSLAGMAVAGKETILEQNRRQLQRQGFDEETTAATLRLLDAMFDELACNNGSQPTPDAEAIAAKLGLTVPDAVMASIQKSVATGSEYFASLLALDPSKKMHLVSCPVLALNGTLDTQVDAQRNLSAIDCGIKHAKTIYMPGLNHLFQHAKTGEVGEYATISETISPEVLTQILTFLRSL